MRPVSPVALVAFISATIALISAVVIVATRDATSPARPSSWWMVLVVGLAFALAELFAFHIEYRREAFSYSVAEVPTAIALAFLSPVAAISVRVLVSVVVIGVRWRQPMFKLAFNAALYAFEMALAYLIVRRLISESVASDTWLLPAIVVGVVIATTVGTAIVSVAIACFEGGLTTKMAEDLKVAIVVGPVVAIVGAISVAPALVEPWFVFCALPPIAAGWLGLQRHGRLAQHYRDLQAIHGFAGVIGHSIDLATVGRTAVEEARRLLRAANGALFVFDEHGDVAMTSRAGSHIDVDPDRLRRDHTDDLAPITLTLEAAGTELANAISAPIVDDGEMIGLLVVTERLGAGVGFDDAEIERARTLATQLSAGLRRALLHSRMEYRALHDDLTGAWNRIAFEQEIQRHRVVPHQCSAVIMLDLDRFKEVNDTLGHHVGDQVLVDFAKRIHRQLGPDDVFARFGGDEFAVLVRRADIDEVHELTERILNQSFVPLRLGDLDVVVTTTTGIAVIEDVDVEIAEILRRADIAMYSAKRDQTRIEIYRADIDRRTPERLSLLGDLREALESGRLEVYFQPKIDLVSNAVTGAEALVRWHHPERGWVSPIEFVTVAEESGLIKQLTDQVLVKAISAVRSWSLAGYELGIAVNLSSHDLLDELLPQRIDRLLDQHAVAPEKVTLEITESALLADTPRINATIQRLDELGVRLSLDDFGTGYSSLGYLRRLPVAELKVDRSFVKNLMADEQDRAIVQSTIDLAHNLGLQVVAEGIEDDLVRAQLEAMGCDIGQGYGICRPIAPDEFDVWLQSCGYLVKAAAAADRSVLTPPGGSIIDR